MTLPIAESWFATEPMGEGVTHIWEPHVDEFIRCNVWHVRGGDSDLLVDSGLGVASLRQGLPDLFTRPVVAVATHTHYDHTEGFDQAEVCFDPRNRIHLYGNRHFPTAPAEGLYLVEVLY